MLARYVKVSGDTSILTRAIPLAEASFFLLFVVFWLLKYL
jgi:hypothetical protein